MRLVSLTLRAYYSACYVLFLLTVGYCIVMGTPPAPSVTAPTPLTLIPLQH